jgi:hypothetical protein
MSNAREDAVAVAGSNLRTYPHYLERVELLLDEVMFRIWVDFEPADPAVGANATAWIVHAHVGEHFADIVDYLSAETIRRLESEAAEYLSGSD